MTLTDPAVGAMLNEMHGLLHEARSNVEIDLGQGQQLINSVAAAESAHQAGSLSVSDLKALTDLVGDSIKPSIEKELSIDNPDAAVLQIRGLLDKLQKVS